MFFCISPGTSEPREKHVTVSLYICSSGSKGRGEVEGIVRSGRPSKVRDEMRELSRGMEEKHVSLKRGHLCYSNYGKGNIPGKYSSRVHIW